MHDFDLTNYRGYKKKQFMLTIEIINLTDLVKT